MQKRLWRIQRFSAYSEKPLNMAKIRFIVDENVDFPVSIISEEKATAHLLLYEDYPHWRILKF